MRRLAFALPLVCISILTSACGTEQNEYFDAGTACLVPENDLYDQLGKDIFYSTRPEVEYDGRPMFVEVVFDEQHLTCEEILLAECDVVVEGFTIEVTSYLETLSNPGGCRLGEDAGRYARCELPFGLAEGTYTLIKDDEVGEIEIPSTARVACAFPED